MKVFLRRVDEIGPCRLKGLTLKNRTTFGWFSYDHDKDPLVVRCNLDSSVILKLPYQQEFMKGLEDLVIQNNLNWEKASLVSGAHEFSQGLAIF